MILIEKALSQYGIVERPGEADNNPEILKYFEAMGEVWVKTDETAWCSAFVNWVAISLNREHSGKLNARSWLSVGEEIADPQVGDIVVFWRKSPHDWRGHVGFFIRRDKNVIWVLGGNQSNMVQISPYPAGRLLGYRRI